MADDGGSAAGAAMGNGHYDDEEGCVHRMSLVLTNKKGVWYP